MKELKFRSKYKNKFYYVTLSEMVDFAGEEVGGSDNYTCFLRGVNDGSKIEQFTGLKDKGGKEIYIGDTIKYRGKIVKIYDLLQFGWFIKEFIVQSKDIEIFHKGQRELKE